MMAEVKCSDMILCEDELKVLLTVNYQNLEEFGKAAGYKINIEKSIAFAYTNNPMAER